MPKLRRLVLLSAAEGQIVQTPRSPRRANPDSRASWTFLLINQPLDFPSATIGECDLQKLSFKFELLILAILKSGRTYLDRCGGRVIEKNMKRSFTALCVFAWDIERRHERVAVKRGSYRDHEDRWSPLETEYSGNLCRRLPDGVSLTLKDFRFKAGWYLIKLHGFGEGCHWLQYGDPSKTMVSVALRAKNLE